MGIEITARRARPDDVGLLTSLYAELRSEMVALHPMWPRADGFDEPIARSFASELDDPDVRIYVGEIDGYPLGFIYGRSEPLKDHEGGVRVVAIRLVFVEEEARAVSVGEVMRDALMDEFRSMGHRLFDAHVLPGHRLAKNFFEAGGFSARTIVMHHDDDRER